MEHSKALVRQLIGSRITCRLTNGRTVKGKLVCLDRLMNIIIADCVCEYEISSAHYTTVTDPPVTGVSVRRLQQAMVPGHLIETVHCERTEFERAQEAAMLMMTS